MGALAYVLESSIVPTCDVWFKENPRACSNKNRLRVDNNDTACVANSRTCTHEECCKPATFASCIEGTAWAAADASNGPLKASDTCENTFAFEECLTYPADAAKCCPHVCNSEHICAGESFENVIDVDAAEDASSNALTECLENTYEPSKFAFWRWGATWRRAKYNKCEKVYAHGYTPETDISVALCCPNNGSAEERRLAANEAEDEDEDAEAAAAPAGVPLYGQELREAACVNGPVTSAPVNPGKPSTTPTKKPSKSSGASTFGFTALAL